MEGLGHCGDGQNAVTLYLKTINVKIIVACHLTIIKRNFKNQCFYLKILAPYNKVNQDLVILGNLFPWSKYSLKRIVGKGQSFNPDRPS